MFFISPDQEEETDASPITDRYHYSCNNNGRSRSLSEGDHMAFFGFIKARERPRTKGGEGANTKERQK